MRKEPIKAPFLQKTKDSDYTDSLAIFKLILRFMNDDTISDRKEQILGDYIAYKGLSNEKLRDEILCQLVNQTWRNEIQANNEKGWLLMANCLSVFPPSPSLYKFLLKYVSDHGYNGYKAICQQKLLQSHNLWARSYPACLLEWKANRKKVNMAVQVCGILYIYCQGPIGQILSRKPIFRENFFYPFPGNKILNRLCLLWLQ